MVHYIEVGQFVQKLLPISNETYNQEKNLFWAITFEPIDKIPCMTSFFHSKLNFPALLFSTRVKIPKNGDFYFFRQNFKKKFLILALEATIFLKPSSYRA